MKDQTDSNAGTLRCRYDNVPIMLTLSFTVLRHSQNLTLRRSAGLLA